jgi:tRNA dimethylallyltransferase
MSEQQARRDTAQATRRFARRQESWFRPDPRIHWLDVSRETGGPAEAAGPSEAGAALLHRALAIVRGTVGDNGPHG